MEVAFSAVDNSSGAVLPGISWINNDNTPANYLDRWPQIFPQADQYAKIFYSSILADLGNSSPDTDNVLTDPILLQNWTSGFTAPSTNINDPSWDYMGPAFFSYDLDPEPRAPLNITPSTIYAEYFCQVPQRKPAGSLIVAIVIADLVILQTLWKLLNWVTTTWVEESNSQSKFCEGCLALMENGHELGPATQDASYKAVNASNGPELQAVRRRRNSSESSEGLVSELRHTSRE